MEIFNGNVFESKTGYTCIIKLLHNNFLYNIYNMIRAMWNTR